MILATLSRIYESTVRLRWALYRQGILKSRALDHAVISVGNLSVGGTGKTPFVLMLSRYLQEKSFRPVILSRGYGGKKEKANLLVSDGKALLVDPEMAGDEPFLLASELEGVPVAVGKNRFAAANLVSASENTIFLLDDGFQHLRLKRDIDLLLVDASSPFGTEQLLPAGRLREPFDALKRADAFVLTRTQLGNERLEDIERQLKEWNSEAPIFRSQTLPVDIGVLSSDKEHSLQSCQGRRYVALVGIGNPEAFLEDVKRAGLVVSRSFIYRDHHKFHQSDLDRALSVCKELKADGILTTTKDAMRLKGLTVPPEKIYLFRIRTAMLDENAFFQWLDLRLNAVHGAIRNLRSMR